MKNFINEAEEEEDYCYGNDDYGEYDEGRIFFSSFLNKKLLIFFFMIFITNRRGYYLHTRLKICWNDLITIRK